MSNISKEDKLKYIFENIEKKKISAYQIAKYTKLNEGGVGRILQKKSKNPHNSSVNLIYDKGF